jgi:hypothetical protein
MTVTILLTREADAHGWSAFGPMPQSSLREGT